MVVAGAYDDLATEWERAAGLVYQPLARALLLASPVDLSGQLVLDVGSGTGAVAQAALMRGARVVATDRSAGMVAHLGGCGWPVVASDALALPFGPGTFAGATAGFLLNHVPPAPTLTALVNVVRAGGVVLATTWDASRPDPVKRAIDRSLGMHGWLMPDWYAALKAEVEPVSGDHRRLRNVAHEVGLTHVTATRHRAQPWVRDPHAAVAYRTAMPHIAPWLAGLGRIERAEAIRQAEVAVAPHLRGWRPAAIILVGTVDPHPK